MRALHSRKTPAHLAESPMQTTILTRPLEHVAIDLLGPLPVTNKDNKYIIVIGDYLTEWNET